MRRFTLLIVLAVVLASVVNARADRRVALVIGNAAYQNTNPLKNPVNDASAIAAALKRLDFDVVFATDVTGDQLPDVLETFDDKLKDADIALFYYAGHGLQLHRRNYLVAVDAQLTSEFKIERETYPIDRIMDTMESWSKLNLVFIDACRNNPLADILRGSIRSASRSAEVGQALAPMQTRSNNTLIVFATAPDKVAEDGDSVDSPFTTALLHHIETPGVEVEVMLKDVTSDVRKATRDRQSPERLSRLDTKFYFKPDRSETATAPPAQIQQNGEEERIYWESVKDSNNRSLLQSYIDRYPTGVFVAIARVEIDKIDKPSTQESKPNPDRAFEEATQAGTSEAYRKFIETFPNDPRAARLRKNLQEDDLWQHAQSEDTVQSMRNYLAAFPSGIYAARAKQRIATLTAPLPQEPAKRSIETNAPQEQPDLGPTMWDHNGSRVRLIASGTSRRFYYEWPRRGMVEEGVRTGTLLFDGNRSGTSYTGTAYVFSKRCGAKPYRVSGTASPDDRHVTLYGEAPTGLDRRCRATRYRNDVLVFDLVE